MRSPSAGLLGTAAERILDVLVGRHCVFCGGSCYTQEHFICAGCLADLPRNEPACPRCASPLPLASPGLPCASCQQGMPPFAEALVPLRYDFPVDAAIRGLKFHGRLYYGNALGEVLVDALSRSSLDPDALLPVPLHWRRQARRGFNQAEVLAARLRRRTGLRFLGAVRRCRATPYQSGLDTGQRRRNLVGAFAVTRPITARHVLLVDDVMTTGATVSQLAACLLEHGVERVSVMALARAVRLS